MIQLLYMSTMVLSMTFVMASHPLSMGFILLMQTTIIAMITGMLSQNFWFSYILFMIMIGGMLVLFIYMTSVASNEKFMYSNKLTMTIIMFLMVSLLLMMMDQYPMYQASLNTDMKESSTMVMFSMSLSKYLNFPTNWIMIMMIIYLLVTLIAVVKITNVTYGPLRQKF